MSAGGTTRWTTPGAAITAAAGVALSDAAKALLKPDHSPRQYVSALVAAGDGLSAVNVIPAALTPREAVWWGAQCIRSVPGLLVDAKTTAAMTAVEKWCANPTDDFRRAAMTASEVANVGTPAGCLAMAIFLMEGSMAPTNVAAVPPPPEVGPKMVASAVTLAAVLIDPVKANERYTHFAQLADAVATGTNRWDGAKPAVASTPAPPSPGAKSFPPYPQAKR